jgi:hypothetical protein
MHRPHPFSSAIEQNRKHRERIERERREAKQQRQQRELERQVSELRQQLRDLSPPKRKRKRKPTPELSPLSLKIEKAIKQHGDPQTSNYKKARRHLKIEMSRTVWWRERKRLGLS